MIHAKVRMVLPQERFNEAVAILAPMTERTRADRGCLGCQLHRDVLEESALIFEELWATEADLERHLRSRDYHQLLLIMELAKTPPEVSFDTVSHSSGFETILKARA